jgi:hypothetical protein
MGLYRQRVGWGKGPRPVMPSDEELFAVMRSVLPRPAARGATTMAERNCRFRLRRRSLKLSASWLYPR